MKERRKYLCMITGLLLLIVVLFLPVFPEAFDKGAVQETNNMDKKELYLWYPWTDEDKSFRKAFLEAVEEYNAGHPDVPVIAEGIETELYQEKLPSAIASNDTPDMYYCYADAYLQNIARSGKALKLNDYLDPDIGEKLQMKSLENMTYKDGIYGLSFTKSVGVLLINRELFKEYDCPVPENWDQLTDVCYKFLDRGVTPIACSGDTASGFRLFLEAVCMSEAGAEVCKNVLDGGTKGYDAFLQGVGKFCFLNSIGAFGENAWDKRTREVEEDFILSRIPMYLTKNDFVGDIIQENSPLYEKIQVLRFPGKMPGMLGGISDAFAVDRSTEYPQEAVRALEDILRRFSRKLYERGAGIPTWEINGAECPDSELYRQIQEEAENAVFMQYWELYLSGQEADSFMSSSKMLFSNELSAEDFVNTFIKNADGSEFK